MKSLIDLYDLIEAENIILEETWDNTCNLNGIYLKIPNSKPVIGIKKSIINNTKKLRSALSEELGHHFTTNGDLIKKSQNYYEQLYKHKEETIAKTWGANFLITDDDFVQALNNCIISVSEMAEYFEVTEEIVKLKINSIVKDEQKYNAIRTNFMKKEIQYNACQI